MMDVGGVATEQVEIDEQAVPVGREPPVRLRYAARQRVVEIVRADIELRLPRRMARDP